MGRILVIDDEELVRHMLRAMLEHAGHEVEEAADGEEGVRLYRERPSDLIVTDIVMPEKEGLEVIQELRRDFPGVKIIAISGGGMISPMSYLSLAKKFGAQRAFFKPIDRKQFLAAVDELLSSD